MARLFANNAFSTLAAAITASATSLSVQANAGSKFPTPTGGDYFMLTLLQMVNGVESNHEIVKVTARSLDTLTIVRAQEGTTARAFGVGDQVSLRGTAGAMSDFAQLAAGGTFASPIFAPTAVAGTNTTQVATTAFTTTAVANAVAQLVNSSPAALDTLSELATALGNDASFATTTATALGNRLRVDTNAQGLTAAQKTNAITNLGLAAVASSGAKADVGLGNVDNTSDVNKPVSTAQQTALNAKAPLASPALTGTPTAPTPAMTDSSTTLATTAFVNSMFNAILSKSIAGGVDVTLTAAEAAYPIIKLTGALTAAINIVVPAAANRFTVWNATTGNFGVTVKTASGTGIFVSPGATSSLFCDGTNVLDANNDTVNIALTGVPTAPTAAAGTNTTQVATTAFVMGAFASPALTGTPTAPTAAGGTNTTQIATTAFVTAAISAGLASPAFTGTPTAPTAAFNTNTTQLATTAFVQALTNGMLTKGVTAGDLTLTAAEAAYPIIKLTGTITANVNIIVPATANKFIVWNATTGAFTLTVKTSAGTGLLVTQGATSSLLCDGTNVIDANNDNANLALTGVPTAPTAAPGTNTTQVATTAFAKALGDTKAALAGSASQNFAANDLAVTSINGGPLAGFRNKIINGAMMIDQRSNGAVNNAAGYCLDKWNSSKAGTGAYSMQRVADAPPGFTNSAKMVVTTATNPAASDVYQFFQVIEGDSAQDLLYGTASAKPITASFWVKASAAGTYGVFLYVPDSGYTTYRSIVQTYTINAANTWEFKTVTFAGSTAYPINLGTAAGILLGFDLGSGTGSNASSAGVWSASPYRRTASCVNFMAIGSGASWQVSGVQFEIGTVATPFEQRQSAVELALCQRYYETGSVHALNWSSATGQYFGAVVPFKVTKRAIPTVTLQGSTYINFCNTPTINDLQTGSFAAYSTTTGASSIVEYNGTYSASADI